MISHWCFRYLDSVHKLVFITNSCSPLNQAPGQVVNYRYPLQVNTCRHPARYSRVPAIGGKLRVQGDPEQG